MDTGELVRELCIETNKLISEAAKKHNLDPFELSMKVAIGSAYTDLKILSFHQNLTFIQSMGRFMQALDDMESKNKDIVNEFYEQKKREESKC